MLREVECPDCAGDLQAEGRSFRNVRCTACDTRYRYKHGELTERPEASLGGVVVPFGATVIATVGAGIWRGLDLGKPLDEVALLAIPCLFLGAIFGVASFAIYMKFTELGLTGKWQVLTIPLSVVGGPTVIVGGLAAIMAILVGTMGVATGGLLFVMGEPEAAHQTFQMFDSNKGFVLLVLGVIGLAFGLAPKDPHY